MQTNGARFMSCDIKDYFLATLMAHPDFMKISLKYFPEDIIKKYNLMQLVDSNGYVYIQINKGMYGLKQAAVLAFDQLTTRLHIAGYPQILGSSSMWKHKTRRTIFCLCVDDFGVKYFNTKDAQYLLDTIGQHYKYTVDWTGKNFCKLIFD